jgi:hypothetical protein
VNEDVQEREMNPEIVANAEKALRQLDENIDGPGVRSAYPSASCELPPVQPSPVPPRTWKKVPRPTTNSFPGVGCGLESNQEYGQPVLSVGDLVRRIPTFSSTSKN